MIEGIDPNTLETNPNVEDHAKMFYSTNMMGSCVQLCCMQWVACLFFILLVVALQVTSFSSFLIITPFWPLAWVVLLLFFCFFCAVGCLDTNEMEGEDGEGQGMATSSSQGAASASASASANKGNEGSGSYVPPEPVMATAFVPPVAPSRDEDRINTGSTSPLVEVASTPEPPTTTRASEID